MYPEAVDGFWLPRELRSRVLSETTEYTYRHFANGRPCATAEDGSVTVRWPNLSVQTWQSLLQALGQQRRRVPSGAEYWVRLQDAMGVVATRFSDEHDPLRQQALATLPAYTGYSEPMIRFTLGSLDMMRLEEFPAALKLVPTLDSSRRWRQMKGLPGRLRFYGSSPGQKILAHIPGMAERPLHGAPKPVETVIGYGAGNVPGTALLIALLGQAVTLEGGPSPVVVARNSRREPIFTPLIFRAIEATDPDILAGVAILIWDYEDRSVQDMLLSKADLVIAAASDGTIAQIAAHAERAAADKGPRLHAHGHKVSFSAIGRDWLVQEGSAVVDTIVGPRRRIDVVGLLAALDSAFWDQNGCLSSRVHFVETNGNDGHSPVDYARCLSESLRLLSSILPRGSWSLQHIRDRFDKYKLLETTGEVKVVSRYEDDYLVAVDRRRLDPQRFSDSVNDCQGRVILVRPVSDLMEIPELYLDLIPEENLQSLSVAVGGAGEGLEPRFLCFADACARCGVTAIRTIGRGAFPQLAYSWDGYIPLDLTRRRPKGRFATIEFDAPFEQVLDTFHAYMKRGAHMGIGSMRR